MRLSVPAIAHTPAIDSAIRVLLFLVCYWPLAAPCRDCLLRPSLLTAVCGGTAVLSRCSFALSAARVVFHLSRCSFVLIVERRCRTRFINGRAHATRPRRRRHGLPRRHYNMGGLVERPRPRQDGQGPAPPRRGEARVFNNKGRDELWLPRRRRQGRGLLVATHPTPDASLENATTMPSQGACAGTTGPFTVQALATGAAPEFDELQVRRRATAGR